MPKSAKKLSDNHRKVLDCYYGVSNFNKTDALTRAGFKKPNKAHKVFSRPSVVAEMKRREEKVRKRYEVTHERIMAELARVAFSSVLDYLQVEPGGRVYIDLSRADADQLKAIGEVTVDTYVEGRGDEAREVKRVRVKPWNKLEALDKLARHGGLSLDKVKVEGTVTLVDRITAARRRVAEGGDGDS